MTNNPHHNMPTNIYPSLTPKKVYVCLYCNYTPTYASYVVLHYPYILPLGYLHTSYSRLTSSLLPPNLRKTNEYSRKRRNRIPNEQKKKRRLSMIRRDEVNSYPFPVSVD